MKWIGTIFCVGLVTLWVALSGYAQSDAGRFRFEHITVDDGLSHSDAMVVAQGADGFIWTGTNKGINRYDGYAIKVYDLPLNDRSGSTSNRIRAMHVGRNGTLWVGVERAGLFRYDATQDRFVSVGAASVAPAHRSRLQRLTETGVLTIASDPRGRIWAGTQRNGLFCLDTDAQGTIRSVHHVHLKAVQPYPSADDFPVSKLAIDRWGTLWVGTYGSGLWSFQTNTVGPGHPDQRAEPVTALTVPSVRTLHLDRRGDLWIGTDTQVWWVAGAQLQQASLGSAQPLKRTFGQVESLYLDSFSRLWVGTNYGLLLMNRRGSPTAGTLPVNETDSHTFLPLDTDPHSINSIRVHDIYEDSFHNLWLATSAGGLNYLQLNAKPFEHLRRELSGQSTPANNYINAILKDEPHNRLWIGTRNGFASYDFSRKTYRNYLDRVLSGSVNGVDVAAFKRASDGALWVGTRYHGLYRLTDGQTLTALPNLSPDDDWKNISIESILEDRYGTIWVGTFNAGIHRFSKQGRHLQAYDQARLPTRQFTALLYEPDTDILWASTRDAGLLKLRVTATSLELLNQFRYEPGKAHGLRTNYTWPLLKDRRGRLWVGTIGGGLHRLFRTAQGREVIESYLHWVPETDVESLLTDEAGNLWIGGSGLYRFNPATKQLVHYDVTDGLQSNAFKVGAAGRAADGTLFFGGTNGITYFQPRAIRANPHPPIMQLTGLRIMNQSVAAGDTLNGRVVLNQPLSASPDVRLKASENDFSIEFVGLTYDNPQKHRYAYQLVGYNTGWVYTTPGQRMAGFANLPAGTYTFLAKGSNGDGIWSDTPARLRVTVLPPWWKTWWAYLLYGMITVGALAWYRRMEMSRQALKNRLAFEQFQNEKEKEVTDLKLRFFTNVSHELRTPLTLILGPMEELVASVGQQADLHEKIMLMHGQTRKLFDLVNQLLDFRKAEAGYVSLRVSEQDSVRFLTEIFLIFKLKAEEQRLTYTLHAPTQPVPLYVDRDKLEIILTNLLSNAFKYTPAGGRVQVSATVVGDPSAAAVRRNGQLLTNYLVISVQDWGVGMNSDELTTIFNPYYQASHTDTLRIMGTGIGLSLVKQLVDRHAGEISVQSEIGQGTTFTLRLPFGRWAGAPVAAGHPRARRTRHLYVPAAGRVNRRYAN